MGNKISLSRPLRAGNFENNLTKKIIPRIQTYACVRTLPSTTVHIKNLSTWSKDARANAMLQFYDTQDPYQHESAVSAYYKRQNSSEIKPFVTASE